MTIFSNALRPFVEAENTSLNVSDLTQSPSPIDLPLKAEIIKSSSEMTNLMKGAFFISEKMITKNLSDRGQVNAKLKNGCTAIHILCAAEGDEAEEDDAAALNCLKILIKAGADVNCSTADGETPLSIAIKLGKINCVKALLAAGADFVSRQKGRTPYQVAVDCGNFECAKVIKKLESEFELQRKIRYLVTQFR